MHITVFGSARLGPEHPSYQDAVALGDLLAEQGHVIVSGGYGGLMEAVSRGAHRRGGQVLGVTVAQWAGKIVPNEFLSEERSAMTLFERLEALIESDALIALPGGAGTLGEVALAWNLRQMNLMPSKPVILVGRSWKALVRSWRRHLIIDERDLALLTLIDTVHDVPGALLEAETSLGRWYG